MWRDEETHPPLLPAGAQNGSARLSSHARGHVHGTRSLVEGLSSASVGTQWRERVSGGEFTTSRVKPKSQERGLKSIVKFNFALRLY